ncbi:MAG: hypothetical protein DWQ35_00360 [Planctomycetota bacterium]|nr:MAG: hypothetical protein DWQ35_00360 [Planctomycetota bacterium]
MIRYENQRDLSALHGALCILEQVAKRSTDQNSRVLAEGAAAELRATLPAEAFNPPSDSAAECKHLAKRYVPTSAAAPLYECLDCGTTVRGAG